MSFLLAMNLVSPPVPDSLPDEDMQSQNEERKTKMIFTQQKLDAAGCRQRYAYEYIHHFNEKKNKRCQPTLKSFLAELFLTREAAFTYPNKEFSPGDCFLSTWDRWLNELKRITPARGINDQMRSQMNQIRDEAQVIFFEYCRKYDSYDSTLFIAATNEVYTFDLDDSTTWAVGINKLTRNVGGTFNITFRRITTQKNIELHELVRQFDVMGAIHAVEQGCGKVAKVEFDIIRAKAPTVPKRILCKKCKGSGNAENTLCQQCNGTGSDRLSTAMIDSTASIIRHEMRQFHDDLGVPFPNDNYVKALDKLIVSAGATEHTFMSRSSLKFTTVPADEMSEWRKRKIAQIDSLCGALKVAEITGVWPRNHMLCDSCRFKLSCFSDKEVFYEKNEVDYQPFF